MIMNMTLAVRKHKVVIALDNLNVWIPGRKDVQRAYFLPARWTEKDYTNNSYNQAYLYILAQNLYLNEPEMIVPMKIVKTRKLTVSVSRS